MIVLPDTSIWIDHLHRTEPRLADFLTRKAALVHPFVVGEISLGNLKPYDELIKSLIRLPRAVKAADEQVLHLIRYERLNGSGIGYIDAHLLAATLLTPGARLWTRDKRLLRVAEQLDLAATFTD